MRPSGSNLIIAHPKRLLGFSRGKIKIAVCNCIVSAELTTGSSNWTSRSGFLNDPSAGSLRTHYKAAATDDTDDTDDLPSRKGHSQARTHRENIREIREIRGQDLDPIAVFSAWFTCLAKAGGKMKNAEGKTSAGVEALRVATHNVENYLE